MNAAIKQPAPAQAPHAHANDARTMRSPFAPLWKRRCDDVGHDFRMADEDPSVDECSRCKVRRY